MAHYEYNRERYKTITLRINQEETELINYLEEQKSTNAYLTELIRKDMRKQTSQDFEVLHTINGIHASMGTFHTWREARDVMEEYALTAPEPGLPIIMVHRFRGTTSNGEKITASEIVGYIEGIETEGQEENENA